MVYQLEPSFQPGYRWDSDKEKVSYSTDPELESIENEKNRTQEEMETLISIDKDLVNFKMYGFWKKGNRLSKDEVISVVRSLPSLEYRKEFSKYLKNNDIKWLQHSLNEKISDWEWNDELMRKYKEYLKSKGIWISNNHIFEDWKLWPQTTETLRFVSQNRSLLHRWQKKWRDGKKLVKKIFFGIDEDKSNNKEKPDVKNKDGKKVENKKRKNKKRKNRKRRK